MGARAYPYESWPRHTRDEVVALGRVVRAFPARAAERVRAELASLLGTEVRVEGALVERCPRSEIALSLGDPLVAIVIETESGSLRGRIAIEVEPRLALSAIDRALGGSAGEAIPTPVVPLSDVERGVVAYLAARALDALDAPWTIAGVVTSPLALAGALGDHGASVWPARVSFGADHGVVRAWLPDRALAMLAASAEAPVPSGLLTLPVDVVVDGARGTLGRAELASIREGDVVVLDETWITTGSAGIGGHPRARLHGGKRLTIRCALGENGIVIESVDVDASAPISEVRKMRDGDTEKNVIDRAGDVPIELAIEIARFALPLAELATLRAGEVLVTGRPVGERVILRAGERAIAEGELVDVDGEVGVRVLALQS